MRSKKFLQAEQAALVWDVPGLVAGVDEAGRGPLAGPVVAAAVILDDHKPIRGLADSKKLTALRREKLFDEIRAKALCCCIAQASVEEIDRLNILQATLLAMRRAVEGLRLKPGRDFEIVNIDDDARYRPFWDLTRAGLRFAAQRLALPMDAGAEDRLMNAYRHLDAFADAREVLHELKKRGVPAGVLWGAQGVLLALAATAYHAVSGGGHRQPIVPPELIVGHGVLGRLLARLNVAAGFPTTVWERDEVRARGGELFVFADSDTQIQSEPGVQVIRMPEHYGALSPILHVVPLQLLAYHTACARGTDVDKPRNLAKSVTVE